MPPYFFWRLKKRIRFKEHSNTIQRLTSRVIKTNLIFVQYLCQKFHYLLGCDHVISARILAAILLVQEKIISYVCQIESLLQITAL